MGKDQDLDQQPLPGISIRALRCDAADEGADCAFFCLCDDGSEYAVKDGKRHASIPHSEWFCTRLGELVGLACPPCRVVLVEETECFGSRWETAPIRDWWIQAHSGQIAFSDLAPSLARILAFDLFVHNDDRHAKNYIVRHQRTKHTALAFDFSRAWLWNGIPPPALPLADGCNTITTHRMLKRLFGDFAEASEIKAVADGLRAVDYKQIEAIIDEHPRPWLTKEQMTSIMNWWKSSVRIERIHQIEEGILNGTFL